MPTGRNRRHNRHLPRGVTLERGTYFYRGADRKRVNLGRDFAAAMRQYGELVGGSPLTTFAAVLDRYQRDITPKKGARTQSDEFGYLAKLRAVLGTLPSRALTPTLCAELRDRIVAKSGAVQANHHLKTLKHVLKCATEWGAVPHNAAREVSKLKVKERDGYVTDEEFAAIYASASPKVQVAMDLAVLTELRHGDLLRLTRADCRDDGIHVRTSKTRRSLIFQWTPELKAVIDRARSRSSRMSGSHCSRRARASRSPATASARFGGARWSQR